MKYTNRFGLPETLVKVITFDDYDPHADYSISQLVNPVRITQLRKRHDSEIETDVSEMIWLLLGNSVHYILDKAAGINDLAEERLHATIGGKKISGKADLLQDDTIWDYKVTSVWSAVFEPKGRDEWHTQLNGYRWLYSIAGFDVKALRICEILRDWQKSKRYEDGYPQIPVKVLGIPFGDVVPYLEQMVGRNEQVKILPDSELPMCTPEQRWDKPTTYAIMRAGQKKAVRVFDTYPSDIPGGCTVVTRQGKSTRCQEYCDVADFCDYGIKVRKEANGE